MTLRRYLAGALAALVAFATSAPAFAQLQVQAYRDVTTGQPQVVDSAHPMPAQLASSNLPGNQPAGPVISVQGCTACLAVSVVNSEGVIAGTPGSAVNAVLFSVDTLGIGGGVSFSLAGTYVGTTVFEASNDNTNWFPAVLSLVGGSVTPTQANQAQNATYGVYFYMATARYFRVRISVYTSGTVTPFAYIRSTPSLGPSLSGLPAGTAQIGSTINIVGALEATTLQGAGLTFNGASRNDSTAIYTKFRCRGSSDQPGTLNVQYSTDLGVTWNNAATAAYTVGGLAAYAAADWVGAQTAAALMRCSWTNTGAATQTTFNLSYASANS